MVGRLQKKRGQKFPSNLLKIPYYARIGLKFSFLKSFFVLLFNFSRKTAFETSLDVNVIITSELLREIGAGCRDQSSIAPGSLVVEESGAQIQGRFYLVKMELSLVFQIIII